VIFPFWLGKTLVIVGHRQSTSVPIVGTFPGLSAGAALRHFPHRVSPAQGMVTDVRARYIVVARL
jgi:hypothetical protein